MANESRSSDTDKQTGGVTIGDVEGGIRDSIIAGRDAIQKITQIFTGDTGKARDWRNKLILLKKVKDFWVKGVLEKSVHSAALIELGKEKQPEAVEHPWDMVLQTLDQPSRPLPSGKKIAEVFDEMGRALLILGEPGSGKTITLLELARDTIALAEQDPTQPIPVVFSLSSWAERRQSLGDWLVDELNAKYQIPRKIGRTWVENNDLLLLLDGLDEVEQAHRGACAEAINRFRQESGLTDMVVCSRIAEFQALATPLKLQGAILLQPLSPQQIDEYFTAAGPKLAALRTALQQDATLQELAQSPLMLSVMSLAYQDVSAEMLETGQFNSTEARRQHLFAAYVERMFKRRRAIQDYTPQQTVSWLTWLAQHMAQHNQSIFLIEGLQPSWLSTAGQRWLYAIGSRLIGGLIVALAGILSYILLGIYNDLEGGGLLLLGWLGTGVTIALIDGLRFHLCRLAVTTNNKSNFWWLTGNVLFVGLSATLVFGVITRSLSVDLTENLVLSFFLSGLPFGLIFGLRGGQRSIQSDIHTVEGLAWSWRRFLIPVLVVGVIFGGVVLAYTSISFQQWFKNSTIIWDAETGQRLISLVGHTNTIREAIWNADGSRILTVSDDNTARVWDAETGRQLVSLRGHMDWIKETIWNADGSRILTASDDGTVRVWDAETGRQLVSCEGHKPSIYEAYWHSDETRILVIGCEQADEGIYCPGDTMWLWDAETGRQLLFLEGHESKVWNADETRFLTVSRDGSVWVWDAETGHQLTLIQGHTARTKMAVWNRDETRILTAGCDQRDDVGFCLEGTARVWNAKTGWQLVSLKGHTDSVWKAVWNADETRILTTSDDRTVRLWDAETGRQLFSLEGHTAPIKEAVWNADGSRILTTRSDGNVRVWNAETGRQLASYERYTGHPFKVIWNANETHFLTANPGGIASVWDAEKGQQLGTLKGHKAWIQEATWNADGTRILTVSHDNTVRIWDAETGRQLASLEGHTDLIWKAIWNANGPRILTASVDGTVRLWDAETGHQLATLGERIGSLTSASFSSNGTQFATTTAVDDLRPLAVSVVVSGLILGLLGGLRINVIETKTLPNQGIRLSARNGVAVGLVSGLLIPSMVGLAITGLIFVFYPTSRQDFLSGLWEFLTGLSGLFVAFAVLTALWYGGLDVVQHLILRLIFYLKGYIPWNLAHFLNYAAERIFLQKVGSGYKFFHRLLQDYFAAKSIEGAS